MNLYLVSCKQASNLIEIDISGELSEDENFLHASIFDVLQTL